MTNYLSALFSTLNPILSVTNLSRLECAETLPRKYILTHLLSPLLCPHSPLVWCSRGLSVSIGWLDPFCTAPISQMGQIDGGAANGKLG